MSEMTRNQKIAEARKQGESFVDISKRFGITSARARQIYLREIKRNDRTEIYDKHDRLNDETGIAVEPCSDVVVLEFKDAYGKMSSRTLTLEQARLLAEVLMDAAFRVERRPPGKSS